MTTIHDVQTMRYAIPRLRTDSPAPDHTVAAEPRSFLKALALVIFAVGVIGAAIVAVTAFLVFPPPAHTTVVRPAAAQVVTPTQAASPAR